MHNRFMTDDAVPSRPGMKFSAVEKTRAHELVVKQIEAGIAEGSLRPGERIPSERELVEQFDLSRPTVREGLRVAESLGLIQIRPGNPNGSIVVAKHQRGVTRVMESLLRGNLANLGNLIELRMILESSACFLAALGPSDRLQPLRDALSKMAAAADPEALESADADFHMAEAAASGNPFLALIIEAMADTIRASIKVGLPSLGWPDAKETALDRHAKILEAIEGGDADRARRVVLENMAATYSPLYPENAKRFNALLSD